MLLMLLLSDPVLRAIDKAAVGGNEKAQDLCSSFLGQGVGLVTEMRSARGVVQDLKRESAERFEGLASSFE